MPLSMIAIVVATSAGIRDDGSCAVPLLGEHRTHALLLGVCLDSKFLKKNPGNGARARRVETRVTQSKRVYSSIHSTLVMQSSVKRRQLGNHSALYANNSV